MKKLLAVLCLVLLTSLAVNTAMAAKNDQKQTQDSQDSATYQKYLSDTVTIRQELASKRAEFQALMSGQNPDPAAAASLSKEIFNLQEKLRAQAPSRGFGRGGGYGYGGCPGSGGYGVGCAVGGGGGCGGGNGGHGRGMGWY